MARCFRSKLPLVVFGAALIAVTAVSAGRSPAFRSTEKAFYASQADLNFVRPGLVIKVTKAEIAADGSVTAWVKFTDTMGAPLDRNGIETPGAISVSFLVAYIPADGSQYTSYITRQRTGGGRTATQATGENTGAWTTIATGEYSYKFANKAPADFDKSATHTIGVYGSRTLTEFGFGVSRADAVLNFVPSGAAVTKVRDVVRTSSCNKCHDQLALHGGNRRSVEVCVLCHQPQTTEPVSNNTVDLPVMVHKIHMGASLPSVIAKQKYMIGTADYSDVVNPSPNMACTVCHEPKSVSGATQSDNWNTKPSRAACGACHDDVKFATGEKHPAGPQFSDNLCANCHTPKGESDFDASIMGAHTVPITSSLLGGVKFTIERVEDVAPGKNPTVTFTVKDKAGNGIPMAQMTSVRLYMGGPSTDIAGYVREDAIKAEGPGDGTYFWTFAAPIPANAPANSTWQFGIEGYRNAPVLAGTAKARTIRDYGINAVMSVGMNGAKAAPRRQSVSTDKCNTCHRSIEFHGGNRNRVEMCTFCHNPTLNVENKSFNFVNMIHRFHNSEVRYPGNIQNCNQCHVGDSQSLPLKEGLMMVTDQSAPMPQTPPITNACTACHEETTTWQHALANTTKLGESCTVCHGRNADFSVAKVHAQ